MGSETTHNTPYRVSPGSNPPLGVAVNLLGTVNVFEAVKALCADGASKLKGACSWTAWFRAENMYIQC